MRLPVFERPLCLPAIVAAAMAAGACAGPERAPHQPIPGVDTERNEVENPYDEPPARETREREPEDRGAAGQAAPAPPAAGGSAPAVQPTATAASADELLGDFAARVAAAHRSDPGLVVVFPALSRAEGTGEPIVTGLGEFMMDETAGALIERGVTGVVAGPALVDQLRAANRGLDALRGIDDVWWLAERIGADYVVFGTADVKDFDPVQKDRVLDVRWMAQRLPAREPVASFRERLAGGPLGRRLYRYHETPGTWKIGDRAAGARPSVQAEVELLAKGLAREIASEHGDELGGSQVQVAPTVVRGRSSRHAELQAWALELHRKLESARRQREGKQAEEEVTEALLEAGPVEVRGEEYASFGDALDAFRRMRNEVWTSAVGDLERDIAAALSEHLRDAVPGIEILADEGQRDAVLALLRREALAAEQEGTVDPDTLARLRSEGVDWLLASTLRRQIESHVLHLTLLDVHSGERWTYRAPFDARFDAELSRALDR